MYPAPVVEYVELGDDDFTLLPTAPVKSKGGRPRTSTNPRTIANRKRVTVWYAFWGETRWRPEFLKICQQLSDSFHEETKAAFARLITEGGYGNIDADLVARGFDAMIDGLWLDMLINPKAVDRDAAKQVVRTYLAGIFPNEFGRQSTGGVAAKAATA